MLGFINKKTSKGKTNGAVKNHPATILAFASKGCPYKVSETDDLITIESQGFLTTPFNLDGEPQKVWDNFKSEVLKAGKLISYKVGVIRDGQLLRGTYACQAVKARLPKGCDAVIAHATEPKKAEAPKPGAADLLSDLDLS